MAEDSDKAFERSSDAPVDLVKERETFVRSFLKKGVELTEELLHENVELRDEAARLRQENARLRAQVASDDAIRSLLAKIEELEVEKKSLVTRSEELAEAQASDEGRYVEIERELNDLANLYVASYQLHASLSVRRVTRHLLDMVGQLVGAFSFAIYAVDGEAGVIRPIASEKVAPEELLPVPLGEGPVGEACLTGIAKIPDKLSNGSIGAPMAVVPLLADGKPVGAITIITMLEQKQGWATVDRELFKLLGAHAGPALVAANLYARVGNPVVALEGLIENIKKRGSLNAPPDRD